MPQRHQVTGDGCRVDLSCNATLKMSGFWSRGLAALPSWEIHFLITAFTPKITAVTPKILVTPAHFLVFCCDKAAIIKAVRLTNRGKPDKYVPLRLKPDRQ